MGTTERGQEDGEPPGGSPLVLVDVTVEVAPPRHDAHDVHLHPDETLSEAMHRITIGQLDRMVSALAHPDGHPVEGVHTARKAMKRTRALLRLVRDEIGYATYRNENVVLRDVARRLAPARDGLVVVRALDDLIARYDHVLAPDAFPGTVALLRINQKRTADTVFADRSVIDDAVMTLRAAKARYARLPGAPGSRGVPAIRDEFDAIDRGLARVYRRARRGHRRSEADPTVANLHEWRKRVKYQRYQLETLTPLWPEALRAHIQALDHLGELLGDEHDLAVLAELIDAQRPASDDPDALSVLRFLIERARTELRDEAFAMAPALFAERPSAYVARIGGAWAATRD